MRNEVCILNPELAKICDEINPGKEFPLLRVRYPYGFQIVDKGVFNFPSHGKKLNSLEDACIANDFKKNLNYSPIPLSLILHNDIEVFIETSRNIIPLNFLRPGDLFGTFESTAYLTETAFKSIWSVTAGGRSVFMIPRITDRGRHNRIRKEFGISVSDPPSDFFNQWKIFKCIYERSGMIDSWYNDILVFTDKWFKNSDDSAWLKFQKYIFKQGWIQLQLLRDATKFGLLWSSFVNKVSDRGLKPRPYLLDTLKHLISIANGLAVAFKPSTTETALPLSLIQDAYISVYNLKDYIPTIMHACKLSEENKKVYYSLAVPTVLESTPYVKNPPSVIKDERDLKRLFEMLVQIIKEDKENINPIEHIRCDFFHTDIDQYGEILSSSSIAEEDNSFTSLNLKKFKGRTFCSTSSFFKGCVRISIVL